MRDFPALETRRQELRHQLGQWQRELSFGVAGSQIDLDRMSLWTEMLREELAELDYVLSYFQQRSWARWQWGLLGAIGALSLLTAATGVWMLLSS